MSDSLTTPIVQTSTYTFRVSYRGVKWDSGGCVLGGVRAYAAPDRHRRRAPAARPPSSPPQDTAELIAYQEGRYGSYEYGRYGNPTTRTVRRRSADEGGARAGRAGAACPPQPTHPYPWPASPHPPRTNLSSIFPLTSGRGEDPGAGARGGLPGVGVGHVGGDDHAAGPAARGGTRGDHHRLLPPHPAVHSDRAAQDGGQGHRDRPRRPRRAGRRPGRPGDTVPLLLRVPHQPLPALRGRGRHRGPLPPQRLPRLH